jgi:preprotein translocase subunit SecG
MVFDILTYVHVLITLGLIVVILLQSGKSAGLGTIGGGAEKILGKKKRSLDHMLSRATVLAAAVFMISALILSVFRG